MIPVDDAPLTDAERAALKANLERVRARIASACARAKRDPREVRLVVVTKYTGAHVARAFVELGQVDLGENRTDRLEAMGAAVPGARWHMVGHLQRNKARQVAGRIGVLHSLDSLDLARKLEQLRPADLPPLEAYLELRLGEGETRSGMEEAELAPFLAGVAGLARVRVVGLMGLPPAGPAETARPHFQRLARLAQALGLSELSMGMTEDLEVAVEEGATVVRVGRALLEGLDPRRLGHG